MKIPIFEYRMHTLVHIQYYYSIFLLTYQEVFQHNENTISRIIVPLSNRILYSMNMHAKWNNERRICLRNLRARNVNKSEFALHILNCRNFIGNFHLESIFSNKNNKTFSLCTRFEHEWLRLYGFFLVCICVCSIPMWFLTIYEMGYCNMQSKYECVCDVTIADCTRTPNVDTPLHNN